MQLAAEHFACFLAMLTHYLHRRCSGHLGVGITGALMLSQAIYWSNRTDDQDGWFYKTMEEWEAETGMTRSEQESARKKLVKVGALHEMKKGVPCRLFYRVNIEAIRANLSAENPQSSLQESCKQGCSKPASKRARKPSPTLGPVHLVLSRFRLSHLPETFQIILRVRSGRCREIVVQLLQQTESEATKLAG